MFLSPEECENSRVLLEKKKNPFFFKTLCATQLNFHFGLCCSYICPLIYRSNIKVSRMVFGNPIHFDANNFQCVQQYAGPKEGTYFFHTISYTEAPYLPTIGPDCCSEYIHI